MKFPARTVSFEAFLLAFLFCPPIAFPLCMPTSVSQSALLITTPVMLDSVHFSRSVVSDSLRPHESQHARPPCPSPTPGVYPNHVHRVGDAIQPSHPLSSPSPQALSLSQHQGFFPELALSSGGQSIGASTSVLPMNIQD